MNQHILPTKLLLMNCQTGSSNKIYLEDISRGNKVVTTRSNNQFFNNNKYSYYYGSKQERRTWHSPHSSSPTSLTNLCIKDSNWLEAKMEKGNFVSECMIKQINEICFLRVFHDDVSFYWLCVVRANWIKSKTYG